MNKKEQLLKEAEEIFEKIDKAYDEIGGCRDSFSSWPENNNEAVGLLKENCNSVRGHLYECRNELRKMMRTINQQS